MSRRATRRSASASGPGEFTVPAVLCFALAVYGIAGGAAAGEDATTAVGVFALACFVLGVWWPVAALAFVRVSVSGPADAAVGSVIPLRVTIAGRGRVEIRSAEATDPWRRTALPATVTIGYRPAARGVIDAVRIQLRTSAPLGVFTRIRTYSVALPRPMHVAPRTEARSFRPGRAPDVRDRDRAGGTGIGVGDAVRSVREYVAGDPARIVHWPTSARRGALHVREHEPPPAVGVAVVADLSGSRPERVAIDAMSVGAAVLAGGGRVWIGTSEGGGAVGGEVTDRRELGRRLARAGPGAPPLPPPGWTVHRAGGDG